LAIRIDQLFGGDQTIRVVEIDRPVLMAGPATLAGNRVKWNSVKSYLVRASADNCEWNVPFTSRAFDSAVSSHNCSLKYYKALLRRREHVINLPHNPLCPLTAAATIASVRGEHFESKRSSAVFGWRITKYNQTKQIYSELSL
jgi:hypothetical protein